MPHWLSRFARWLTWGGEKSLGMRAEKLARQHLKSEGYRILGSNLRNRYGEVDVLAMAPDGRTVVVVEVKAGSSTNPNLQPELHVNMHKQRKLTALAAQLARRYKLTNHPIRFDVIGVVWPEHAQPTLRHHRAAFESHV